MTDSKQNDSLPNQAAPTIPIPKWDPQVNDLVYFCHSFRPTETWKIWKVTSVRQSAQNQSWIGVDVERLDGSEKLADYDKSKFVLFCREQRFD